MAFHSYHMSLLLAAYDCVACCADPDDPEHWERGVG